MCLGNGSELSENFWLLITVGKTPSPEAFEFAMG
jgi:hypothetical protein